MAVVCSATVPETNVGKLLDKRSEANHPPKNNAVTAAHTKTERRARRARTASSSLIIGNIAVRDSRSERNAIIIAIIVAPTLSAARINKIVGKGTVKSYSIISICCGRSTIISGAFSYIFT